ncbi:MAG: hypothetical protein ACKOQO_02230, partial [Candidatus Limnocylindrus sp.]
DVLRGVGVTTLFYEPSTRTRISFEAAAASPLRSPGVSGVNANRDLQRQGDGGGYAPPLGRPG